MIYVATLTAAGHQFKYRHARRDAVVAWVYAMLTEEACPVPATVEIRRGATRDTYHVRRQDGDLVVTDSERDPWTARGGPWAI